MAIMDLILAARHMVTQAEEIGVINSPIQLMHAVIQQELSSEVEKLEAMMALPNEKAITAEFIRLCHARDLQNQGTALHFVSTPNGFCNTLYFNIATLLYPGVGFQDVFQLLVPHVTSQWTVDVTIAPQRERGRLKECVSVIERPVSDTGTFLALLPVMIDTFQHVLLHNRSVFPLGEIEFFDFNVHSLLHKWLTDEHKLSLLQAIASHNEALSSLYTVIERLNGQGATLREVIQPIAQRMSLSGSGSGSGEYASEAGSQAALRLLHYYSNLPTDIKTTLGGCTHGTPVYFSQVMEQIRNQSCIEVASSHLLDILAYPENQAMLETRPFISLEEKTALLKHYKKKPGEPIVTTCGALSTNRLPVDLARVFFQQIIIDDLETGILYLTSFSPEQYAILLSEARIASYINWQFIYPLLNDAQRQALERGIAAFVQRDIERAAPEERLNVIKALSEHKRNLLIQSILIEPSVFPMLLNLFPEDHRVALLWALDWKKILQKCADERSYVPILAVLDSLTPIERAHQIDERVLLLTATNPDLIQTVLSHLSEEDLLTVINRYESFEHRVSPMISDSGSIDAFKILYPMLSRETWLKAMSNNRGILRAAAVNSPEVMRILLSLYPLEERFERMQESMPYPEHIKHPGCIALYLSLYPEHQRLNVLKETGFLKRREMDHETFSALSSVLPKTELRALLDSMNPEPGELLLKATDIDGFQNLLTLYSDVEIQRLINQERYPSFLIRVYLKFPSLLPMILGYLPEEERLPVLLRKLTYNSDFLIIGFMRSIATLQIVFSLLPDDQQLTALRAVLLPSELRGMPDELKSFLDQVSTRLTPEDCSVLIQDEFMLARIPELQRADFVKTLQEKITMQHGKNPHTLFAEKKDTPQGSTVVKPETPPNP